jgi:excinuclease ABC subunit A
MPNRNLIIEGAEENNLKQIDVEIPLQQITTIMGVSGSGKSSLIYKVIAAEAQRKEKIDSGNANCRDYAIRPKFKKIENLPYCVVVKQRGLQQSQTSTLATVSGLHELLRNEFVHHGKIICQCGAEVFPPTINDIAAFLETNYPQNTIALFAIVADEKYTDCTEEIALLKKHQIEEAIIMSSYDGKERIKKVKTLKPLNNQDANTIKIDLGTFKIISELQRALNHYQMIALDSFQVLVNNQSYHFKYDYICSHCHRLYHPISSSLLSFNTHNNLKKISGVCETCQGVGKLQTLNYEQLILPDKQLREHFLNLEHNGNCYKYTSLCDDTFEKLCKKHKINMNQMFFELAEENQQTIKHFLEDKLFSKNHVKINKFIEQSVCPTCNGSRLNYKANAIKLHGYSISELLALTVDELLEIIKDKKTNSFKINNILQALTQATVGYLSLERTTNTLSGGELQRIKMAIQLNTHFKHLLYILDEPSIGLHAYDNLKFINLIKALKEQQNTIIISEHNQHYIENADYLIELGAGAGKNGGQVIFSGKTNDYQYSSVEIKRTPHQIDLKNAIQLIDVCYHNIQHQNFTIPLCGLIVVSGVSGSGKSSLIHHVLSPIIKQYLVDKTISTRYVKSVKNLERLQNLVELDQSQIGINSRSIIATYLGFFDKIREIFANSDIAILLNLTPSAFSFNAEEGQCEYCKGLGEIENNICPSCLGYRYKPQILEATYQNLSISEVLNLTVDEAQVFFNKHNELSLYFNILINLGLGHLTLGRTTPTLSGGEGQRLKLAKSLIESTNKIKKGNFIYILDEPTTGLSNKDINKLFTIFDDILQYKNTIIVIEHNLTMIKHSDYIIDMGLGAGKLGGKNIFSGDYNDLLKHPFSITAKALQHNDVNRAECFYKSGSLLQEKHYPKLKDLTILNSCQKIYLTGECFELEKQLLDNYSLVLEKNMRYFKTKEALFLFISQQLNDVKNFAFNPFTIDFFIYKKIAYSDIKEKLLKLSKIGFDEIHISNVIFSLKKDLSKVIKLDPWEFKVVTNKVEQAYHYGNGWLSVIFNNEKILELATRLVSVSNKIIGSPKITTSTFNRYLNSCRECYGSGLLLGLDENKIIENNKLSILDEGFLKKNIADKLKAEMRLEIKPALKKLREEGLFDFSKDFNQLDDEEKFMFLYGFIHKKFLKPTGNKDYKSDYIAWKGLYFYIRDNLSKFENIIGKEISSTMTNHCCPVCHGSGFNRELEFFTFEDIPIWYEGYRKKDKIC